VDEVHKKGGLLFIQIVHAGRVTDPALNGGLEHWAPSAIAIRKDKNHNLKGANYAVPK
jgi:2,4-dienoyl-CoA reductase-like NADH-dependent reductase (Old Yellow Enzyme family)